MFYHDLGLNGQSPSDYTLIRLVSAPMQYLVTIYGYITYTNVYHGGVSEHQRVHTV